MPAIRKPKGRKASIVVRRHSGPDIVACETDRIDLTTPGGAEFQVMLLGERLVILERSGQPIAVCPRVANGVQIMLEPR